MLLRTDTRTSSKLALRWIVPALLLLFGLGYAALRTESVVEEPPEPPPAGTYYCDMETVDGDDYVGSGGLRYEKAEWRSAEQARSGKYSCKVPTAESDQYALSTRLEAVSPGDLYRVSVWLNKDVNVTTTLVVSDADGGDFYQATREVVEKDEEGWRLYQMDVLLSYRDTPKNLLVYVYTNGARAAYFDDLTIERIDSFAEAAFQPDVLDLEISETGMERFRAKRKAALRLGILVNEEDDWVNAKLNGRSAKLRLKGDWLDHLKEDKWSFRVRMKDSEVWRGMVTFSLQTPKARYYLHEYLLHLLWQKQEVLAPRYDFVELRLNGKSLGVYAYEEHFEKQLVEAQQRREGPIVRFGEGGYWGTHRQQLEGIGTIAYDVYYPERNIAAAAIEPFRESKLRASETLSAQFERAHALMEQFRRGLTPVAEVFDLKRLAAYYAVADVMAAYHGIVWHNQRFYYNPVIDRLEPIGYDGYGGPPARRSVFLAEGYTNPRQLNSGRLYQTLFLDTAFVSAYTADLYRLSDPAYLTTFLEETRQQWLPRAEFLRREFADDYSFNPSLLVEDAQFVRTKLLPLNEYSLRAYATPGEGDQRLEVANLHTLPVRITGYRYKPDGPTLSLAESLVLPAASPRNLLLGLQRDTSGALTSLQDLSRDAMLALRRQRSLSYRTLTIPRGAQTLVFRPLGIDTSFTARILDYTAPDLATSISQRLEFSAPRDTQYYQVIADRIVFPAARQQIDRDLLIPKGYEVVFEPGAQLDFVGGSAFISKSPLTAFGTENAPIIITSSDRSATGFTVLQAPGQSRLKRVRFDGFGTLRKGDWGLTGAVNFYESDVLLEDVAVVQNRCEDALNVVRAEVTVDGLLVADTPSDGFDCDFCTGTVKNARFERTGNDGMDVSGSVLTVRGARFIDNGDKGLSVGEDSDVILFDAYVRGAVIGMAAKDLSTLAVDFSRLENCDQGFVAYQKKPEFGPAYIVVKDYAADGVRRLREAGPGSEVRVATSK